MNRAAPPAFLGTSYRFVLISFCPRELSHYGVISEHYRIFKGLTTRQPTTFFSFFPTFVSVVCPTGPYPPLRLARRPNRGLIGGGWTTSVAVGLWPGFEISGFFPPPLQALRRLPALHYAQGLCPIRSRMSATISPVHLFTLSGLVKHVPRAFVQPISHRYPTICLNTQCSLRECTSSTPTNPLHRRHRFCGGKNTTQTPSPPRWAQNFY